MKLFHFDPQTGVTIDRFDSIGAVYGRVARVNDELQIGCIHVQPGGVVGYHQAVKPQLFLVVQGSGLVRGEEPTFTPIAAGQAAFWQAGEWHETRSESGLSAIVIEGVALQPDVIKIPEG